jgi:hypothetical protein
LQTVASGLLSSIVAGAPAAARADPFADHPQSHTFVSVGAIGDVGGHLANGAPGTGVVTAGGGELTFTHWLGPIGETLENGRVALGVFGQVEAVSPDGHLRTAFGLQVSRFLLGGELGAVYERGSGPYAASWGLHAAPFVSVGVLYLALRAELPVAAAGEGTVYGTGLAVVLGLKAPIPLDRGTIFDSSTFH